MGLAKKMIGVWRKITFSDAGEIVLDFDLPALEDAGHGTVTSELKKLNNVFIDWQNPGTKTKGKVSVVVLVLNNPELSIRCVESVLACQNKVGTELIIVDNGSGRETSLKLRQLKKQYPSSIKLIRNTRNLNFALGNNIGFSYATGEICVFLNNDTYVTPGWLDALVKPLRRAEIKAVQPVLLFPDDTIQCIGVVFSKKSALGYGLYAHLPKTAKNAIKSRELQAVTAACIAVRSEDFAKAKGFDPSFVNGQEDIDLCLRLIAEGGACYCTADSVVYHDESKTPGRGKYIPDNRKIFIGRWQGKVKPDDMRYYKQDGYTVAEWTPDSRESLDRGLEVYTPVFKKAER